METIQVKSDHYFPPIQQGGKVLPSVPGADVVSRDPREEKRVHGGAQRPAPGRSPRNHRYSKMTNAMFQAVSDCRYQQVKFFLDSGVRANARSSSVLISALRIDDEEKRGKMFNFLVKKGADCGGRDPATRRSILSCACALGRVEQVVKILEMCKGDIDFQKGDDSGMVPLHHAVSSGNYETVQLIVKAMDKYRLSVDISDKNGLTPYLYAKRLGLFGISNLLVTEGRACPYQFDTVTYKSADEWSELGMRERKRKARLERARKIAWVKIKGRFPTLQTDNITSLKLPNLKLTTSENQTRDISMRELSMVRVETNGVGNGLPLNSKTKERKRKLGVVYMTYPINENVETNTTVGGNGNDAAPSVAVTSSTESNLVTNPSVSSSNWTDDKTAGSNMNSALSLLTFAQQQGHGRHPDHFVGSQFDTSKAAEYGGILGSINDMMAILSDQQSHAFRQTVKQPSPLIQRHAPSRTTLAKPRVSTLAILLGKEHSNQNASKKSKRKTTQQTKASTTQRENRRKGARNGKKPYAVLPAIETVKDEEGLSYS